jgi:hypothetical protein
MPTIGESLHLFYSSAVIYLFECLSPSGGGGGGRISKMSYYNVEMAELISSFRGTKCQPKGSLTLIKIA